MLAKIFGDQRIFGREAAVEAHFVGAGFGGDLVDPDAVNAVLVEKLAGGLKDPVAHPRLGRNARAQLLVASAYACFIDTHAQLSIDNDVTGR